MSRMFVCGTYLQVKLREVDIPVKEYPFNKKGPRRALIT